MSCSFGLHVGQSSSCLAVTRDGRCDVVANAAGHRVTPAVVGWNEGEVIVGLSAKQFAARFPRQVVLRGNRALLGRTTKDDVVQKLASESGKDTALILTDSENPSYDIEVKEGTKKRITPREVHIHILKDMKDIALAHSTAADDTELNTVLTVPADFTENQRQIIKNCAEQAGYKILQVISGPASACLAYTLGQQDTHSPLTYSVIYRAGGSSLTVTLVTVTAGFVSIIKSVQKDIGGDQITKVVADYLAQEFQRKYKVDPRETKRGKQKLIFNGENLKHVLSTLETGSCYIESLYDGIDFNCNLTRARFENEIGKILSDYISPVHEILSQSDIDASLVSNVIFCGGTAKIPKIQKAISAIFKKAEILNTISPDEVLAVGAATQAGLLSEPFQFEEMSPQLKALNFEMIYETEGHPEPQTLIPFLTPIPVRKHHHIETKDSSVSVSISLRAKDNTCQTLSKLSLSELDTQNAKVSLAAHIHRDGSLHLSLTDKATGKINQITLDNNNME